MEAELKPLHDALAQTLAPDPVNIYNFIAFIRANIYYKYTEQC